MAQQKIYHWKHGWIPLDHYAAMEKDNGRESTSKLTPSVEKIAKAPKVSKAVDSSYRGEHSSPGPDGSGAPMYALERLLPTDIYDARVQRQYYGTGDDRADAESFAVINSAKGHPGKIVRVYRALPKDQKKINSGDWVTTSRTYAKDHVASALNGNGHVISTLVPARQLFNSGDSVNEWGWWDVEQTAEDKAAQQEIIARRQQRASGNA